MLSAFNPWRAGAISLDVRSAATASREAVLARQSSRLKALLRSAAKRSRLYRELLRGKVADTVSLHEFPVMTKQELMARFDDWVVDPNLSLDALRAFTADPSRVGEALPGDYIVWESSGSSGEPGLFVQDAHSMAVYDALEALRRPPLRPVQRMLDPWFMSERVAFVGATTGHFATTVSFERVRRLNPYAAATSGSFSFLQPVCDLVAQLNRHAPTILATYPTAALLLAEEAAAGRLRVALHEVWTGGETLSPSVRRFIQESFGCEVAHSYGASEFLPLASECSQGRLHVNIDWVILESVDDEHQPVPAGQAGSTTLLTNLANHVQPLIRYDLGDRITLHDTRCACGSPLPMVDVQGRVDDSLLLRDDAGRPVRLLPLALTTVLEDEAGVFDFQLAHQRDDSLLLRIGYDGEAGARALERAEAALSAYLRRQGLPRVPIHGRCGEPAVRGPSGKVPRVVAC